MESTKPIEFSQHAIQRLTQRGATEAEAIAAIREGDWTAARGDRYESEAVFGYNSQWHGRHYRYKTVRCVFAEESARIVVVTVYVYFS